MTIHIAKRPGLKAFLKKMSKHYQLALYTSSVREVYFVPYGLYLIEFFLSMLTLYSKL